MSTESPEIIQADFGGFNPRFLGVNLKLNSPEAWKTFRDYLLSDTSTSSATPLLEEIATKSVLEHEVRHYHDFLISPYSSGLLRLRFQAFVNGAMALSFGRNLPGNCFPVPISRWLVMNTSERARQLKEWQVDAPPPTGSAWESIPLFIQSQENLLAHAMAGVTDISELPVGKQFDLLVLNSVRGYERIEQMVRGFARSKDHLEFQPYNVYEATALTIQIAAIFQSQGLPETTRFIDFLLNSHATYARLWKHFYNLALLLEEERSGPESDSDLISQVLPSIMRMGVWCILGSYEMEGTDACPALRFEKLLAHLVQNSKNQLNWKNRVAETWDYWDLQIGTTPWRTALEALLEFNRRGSDMYRRLADSVGEHSRSFADLATSLMETFLKEQQVMIKYLLSEPEKIVHPHLYLNAKPGDFPLPHVKVELDGFALPLSALPGPIFRSLWTLKNAGVPFTTRFVVDMSAYKDGEKLLDEIVLAETMMNWCDLVFSEHMMPWEVYKNIRLELENLTQKRLLIIV
jgi:hypothetical protein